MQLLTLMLQKSAEVRKERLMVKKKKKGPVILRQNILTQDFTPNVSLNKSCSFHTLCRSVNPAGLQLRMFEWRQH